MNQIRYPAWCRALIHIKLVVRWLSWQRGVLNFLDLAQLVAKSHLVNDKSRLPADRFLSEEFECP